MPLPKSMFLLAGLAWGLLLPGCRTTSSREALAEPAGQYVILISKATDGMPDWRAVATTLAQRHRGARILIYETQPTTVLPALQAQPPRWLCWVARPEELGAQPVAGMHRLCRSIDADPYTDVFWGIVTGDTAATAAALASPGAPLTVRKVVANTEFAMECVETGKWFSELRAGEVWSKQKGGQAVKVAGEADSTAGLVKAFNDERPDAILTSGHASEQDWQPGYAYRNGVFVQKDGRIIGKALDGSVQTVDSPNPKVYLGIGNCLIGNVPGKPGCMATAWMAGGGVRQFVGYTVPTWYGYGGWGVLDYFIEQPGRYSLTEAFFANQQALVWRLAGQPAADDRRGLEYDSDHVAFYGDPQWDARLAPGPLRWREEFRETAPGEFTWTVTPTAGDQSFATVNRNGSQRGGRPLVRFLPRRFASMELLEGARWQPFLADDFILLPRPAGPVEKITIRFKGK